MQRRWTKGPVATLTSRWRTAHDRSGVGPTASTRLLRWGVAAIVLMAPVTVVAVSSGSAESTTESSAGYVTFAPPATGANGAYADSVTYPVPYSLPGVRDNVVGDTFNFTIAGANSAHCSIKSSGEGFAYSSTGSCTLSVTGVLGAGDSDDSSNGGNSGGREANGADDGAATGTLTLTVKKSNQSISATSLSGTVSTPVTLAASGYSGTGAVSFALVGGGTASGCAVNGSGQLTSTSAGTCLVTATIAADPYYNAATSSPASITLARKGQKIDASSLSGPFGATITLKATGYSGAGNVTFAVVGGGTASGCSVSGGDKLNSSSPGTCRVTASIAADSSYSAATSASATITLIAPTPVHVPPPTTTTSTTTTTTTTIKTTTTTTTTTLPPIPPVHIKSSPPPATISISVGPFAEGSYSLSKKLVKQVADLARVVKSRRYKSVDLAGYTDNVFSPVFNQTLNQSRASVVEALLVADLSALGDSKVTITIVVGGPLIVTASNATAKGRAANRRVIATLKAG